MSARAEVSTPVQEPPAGQSGAKTMSVALIGPNDAHRKLMAKALSGSHGRTVREFADYPANLGEVPRLLEQKFDVVIIDVDSDESYALALVEDIAASGKAMVIVYSKRNDQALLARCGQAGAHDFLPLPADEEEEQHNELVQAAPVDEPAVPSGLHIVEKAPVVHERVHTAATDAHPPSALETTFKEEAKTEIVSAPNIEAPVQDFKDWDAEHLFSMMPHAAREAAAKAKEAEAKEAAAKEAAAKAAAAKAAAAKEAAAKESDAREAAKAAELIAKTKEEILRKSSGPATFAVAPKITPPKVSPARDSVQNPAPEPSRSEAPGEHLSSLFATPPPKVKIAPDMPIFRAEIEEKEAEPGNDVMKWVFIAAGLGMLVGLVLLIFVRPAQKSAAPPAPQPQQQVQDQPEVPVSTPQVETVTTTPKPSPIPSAPNMAAKADTTAPAPKNGVSSDMMDAQLSAPSKIARPVRTSPSDEPSPSSFAPVSLDNGSVPGTVFNGGNKVAVMPAVSAISAGVAEGMLLHKTEPVYPRIAKDSRVSGTVVLRATITKQGTIEGVRVISGPRMLGPAAIDAVKTWRYRPYMLNNQPVPVDTTINVVFSLNDH